MPASTSIVIPTRDRLDYLDVTLASIAEQASSAGAEIIVVDDAGHSDAAKELAARHGARYEPHDTPRGLNAARNTGIARSSGELIAFLDDDVRAMPNWLPALLEGERRHPAAAVLAGRITARLEGHALRSCGREAPPVTTLDLGTDDVQTRFAWGANIAIRRSALERIGPFDETLPTGGDEQEWQERLYAASPGQALVVYVALAQVEHRRVGADARLRALARTALGRGRSARRLDARQGRAPGVGRELMTLSLCVGHVLRRRCPAGLIGVAHSAGRLSEALAERRRSSRSPAPAQGAGKQSGEDFLSGASGTVGGLDAQRRAITDLLVDASEHLSGRSRRLRLAARSSPPRRSVLILSATRPERVEYTNAIRAELMRSRHKVDLQARAPAGLGKFETLNILLEQHPAGEHDWLLLIDDDIGLPRGFLDRFLYLCERFELTLAQPAHRLNSHAAWQVTRRRRGSLVRETRFVEIGPVTAFACPAFEQVLPFPALRMGWGLDLHWAALARERGWRCGVTDAVAISHRAAPAADGYSRAAAIAEAREFLAGRPYVPAAEAELTLQTHRRW
jgi:GT2 family glycosyltransferase